MRKIRRVVTTNSEGRSTLLFDGVCPHVSGPLTDLWATDAEAPALEGTTDSADRPTRMDPPAGGSIFRFLEIGPHSDRTGKDLEREFETLFESVDATHSRVDTRRHPGMHKTSTIDYVIVLSGKLTLLLDDGEATDLEPFDVVVQRGTNHAWVNNQSEPALVASVQLDVKAGA